MLFRSPDVEDEPRDRNLKEKPIKARDHMCDSVRYLLMRLPDDPNNLKTSSHRPPERYIMGEDEDELDLKGDKNNFLSYI